MYIGNKKRDEGLRKEGLKFSIDSFNKYKLNQTIYDYTKEKSDSLWEMMAASFKGELSETDK